MSTWRWRRSRLVLVALSIALAPVAASSQEWREVDEPAKLVFSAPGLTWAPATGVQE